jgi:hypothetical protein
MAPAPPGTPFAGRVAPESALTAVSETAEVGLVKVKSAAISTAIAQLPFDNRRKSA